MIRRISCYVCFVLTLAVAGCRSTPDPVPPVSLDQDHWDNTGEEVIR